MLNRFALAVMGVSIMSNPVADSSNMVERYFIHILGGGLGITTDDKISISKIGRRWIVERSAKDHNWCGQRNFDRRGPCAATNTIRHEWLDGKTCPEISLAMSRLIDTWRADTSIPEKTKPLISDTPKFTIIDKDPANNRGPTKTVEEFTGPLEGWWRATMVSTHDCWSDASPIDANIQKKGGH